MGERFDMSRPIYAQIVERLKAKILAGIYPPGGHLDSVRDMAAAAGGRAVRIVPPCVPAAQTVADDAVFRDHQRQAAVYHRLAGQNLPQIPDLLPPQLHGHRGGGKTQLLPEQQGPAVENIQPKISP